jgi:outer membrane protein TolC
LLSTLPFALLLVADADASTFAELAGAARASSSTAQIVALEDRRRGAEVNAAVSRVLPSVSLSDALTAVWLNTDRFPQPGESLEGCEARLGRVCESLLVMGDGLSVPGEAVNHGLNLVGTQPLWNGRAVMGIAQATTLRRLSQTQGRLRLDDEAGDLVRSYVELQAAVEARRLTQDALGIAEQALAAARTARAAGGATDLDVDLAGFEVARLETDLRQTERVVPRALGELWAISGAPGLSTQRVCPLMEVADRGEAIDLDGAPRVELSRQQLELDRHDRRLSQLSFLPTITALGGVSSAGRGEDLSASFADFDQSYRYVGATASWTLFSGGGRVFDNRSSTWSVQASQLELEQVARDLALDDVESAARLRDLAEELDSGVQQLELRRRVLAATEDSYEHGGRTSLDQVLQARRVVTELEAQLVKTKKEQLLTLTRRWVQAGRALDLVALLARSDQGHAEAGRCVELSP